MTSSPGVPDPTSILAMAAARRTELSRNWATAEDLGEGATEMRKSGQLLGVYLTDPQPHYRFPAWQFQQDGWPVAHFSEMLRIMRDHGGYLDKHRSPTGWSEVEWFLTPHVLLNGECPAEVLAHDPQAVVEAARMGFIEDGNAGGF